MDSAFSFSYRIGDKFTWCGFVFSWVGGVESSILLPPLLDGRVARREMFYLSIILSDPPLDTKSSHQQPTFHKPISINPILKRSAESLIRSLNLNPASRSQSSHLHLHLHLTNTSNRSLVEPDCQLSTLYFFTPRFCYAFTLTLSTFKHGLVLFNPANHLKLPIPIACICIFFHTFIPPSFHTFIPPPFIPPYIHPHTSTISIPISTTSYTSMHHDHFAFLGFFGLTD